MVQPDNNPKTTPLSPISEPPAPLQQEELADVVVSGQSHQDANVPWYITLRPALFCLMFLALAEVGARLYFDNTICLVQERFDNFPGPAIEDEFVAQMRRDSAYKVLIVGDSTVVGPSLLGKDDTIPRKLEQELNHRLPNRPIHVWNLSIAGARATDELCLLKKGLEGKPDFIILQANFFICNMVYDPKAGYHVEPILNPWLAYNLDKVPASIAPLLPKRDWQDQLDDNLTSFVEKHVRFYGMRQAINAKMFGVQPRVAPYETPNPLIMAGVNAAKQLHKLEAEPWTRHGIKLANFVGSYGRPLTEDNFNGIHYREVMQILQQSGIPAITYLTPQNPGITRVVVEPERYQTSRHMLSSFFEGYGIPHYDLCDLVPDQYFVDNDHMLGEGSQRVALALADAITPCIQSGGLTAAGGQGNHTVQAARRGDTPAN
jgi:hypothetical protein